MRSLCYTLVDLVVVSPKGPLQVRFLLGVLKTVGFGKLSLTVFVFHCVRFLPHIVTGSRKLWDFLLTKENRLLIKYILL